MSPRVLLQRIREAFKIRRSGLLKVVHYKSQFVGELGLDRVLLRLSPVLHFVFFGADQNKTPNPYFDTEYYRDRYPEVSSSGINPLAHYIDRGAAQRLDPSPWFGTAYYFDSNPDIPRSSANPLVHFLDRGRADGSFPSAIAEKVKQLDEPRTFEHEEGRRWLNLGLGPKAPQAPREPGCGRTIRFDWDKGGWNNIRMQAEIMVCLADRFERALILPDADRWYMVPGDSTHLFDFFDRQSFEAVVPVQHGFSSDEWEVPAGLAVTNTTRLSRRAFAEQQHRESWYFPSSTRMYGTLGDVLGSDPHNYSLVHEAFRLRSDLLNLASARLEEHGLRPGSYLAAHIRRGDFQYPEMRHLSIDGIVRSLRKHGADDAESLLIASDAYDEALLDRLLEEGWTPVCWAGETTGSAKLEGVLDMLCCCLAWRFVGTTLSTFSNGIMQWRGYVSLVPEAHVDAVPRFTADLDVVYWWARVDQHAWLTV